MIGDQGVFDERALTHDAFLNGKIRVWQPSSGYRAGTDAVFLAAAVPVHSGQDVLELGCGVGVAALCLATRVPGVRVIGVERQSAYAALAQKNADELQLPVSVVTADLGHLPPVLRAQSFHHVMANPPFFKSGHGTNARDSGRNAALREGEDTPLHTWITTARARLHPKGWLTLIQSIDRLPDCVAACAEGFGSMSILPIAPRPGHMPGRFILRARKGASGPFRLLPPVTLHRAAHHGGVRDDFSPIARAVLRDGHPLSWE